MDTYYYRIIDIQRAGALVFIMKIEPARMPCV